MATIQNTHRHEGTTRSSCVAMIGPRPNPKSAKPLCCSPCSSPRRDGCAAAAVAAKLVGQYRSFEQPHHSAHEQQRSEAGRGARQARHQREQQNGGHEHTPVSYRIGQPSADNGEDAPDESQGTHEISDRLVIEAEILRHERKERRHDPAIESDETKAERQQRDGFPLVLCIPLG